MRKPADDSDSMNLKSMCVPQLSVFLDDRRFLHAMMLKTWSLNSMIMNVDIIIRYCDR